MWKTPKNIFLNIKTLISGQWDSFSDLYMYWECGSECFLTFIQPSFIILGLVVKPQNITSLSQQFDTLNQESSQGSRVGAVDDFVSQKIRGQIVTDHNSALNILFPAINTNVSHLKISIKSHYFSKYLPPSCLVSFLSEMLLE